MSDLLVEIFAGIAVLILSGIGSAVGILIKNRYFKERRVLPETLVKKKVDKRYTYLKGSWNLYWLSYNPSNSSDIVWFKGIQELNVKNYYVYGITEFPDHPLLTLPSKLVGEIHSGKLIVLDMYTGDENEFTSIIYHSLRSENLLVGIWNGFDNLLRPVAGPAILSREELGVHDLNLIVKQSMLTLIVPGEYSFYESSDSAIKLTNP